MTPIEILMDEHRVIEQVLDVLERIVQQSAVQGILDGQSAGKAIDFFRVFADGCHHSKEEDHLFPMLEARGLPRDGGPTGVMLAEHEEGRALVRGMKEEIDAAAKGEPDALKRFSQQAGSYIELLRQHIDKEDRCLFPMVARTLNAEDHRALEAAFHDVAHEGTCPHLHDKYLKLADKLADRFGVQSTHARQGAVPGH